MTVSRRVFTTLPWGWSPQRQPSAVCARIGQPWTSGAATKRAARNQPDDVPAVLLARLAVDRRYLGQGLAAALLKHFLLKAVEVAAVIGARIVLAHAKDEEAKEFYLHHEFEPSPIDDLTLMRAIVDLT